ncbi:MAG: cytochrome P450 [Bryobacteraceae bacterium]|nr:cytochrome P450 [Bryobacteraceae bacterium]
MSTAAVPVRRPPGPKSRPVVGYLPEFRKNPPPLLARFAREYGDIVYFKLGPQHTYLLNHPDFVKDVFVTHSANFTKSRILQRAKSLLGEGLLTSEGDAHKRQRRLMQPAFHHQRLIGYSRQMSRYAGLWRGRWKDGETRDIHEEMMRLTLAIVGMTLFSADVEGDAPEVGEALGQILDLFNFLFLPFSEYLEVLPIPPVRRMEKAREQLDSIIYRVIRERRASGEDKGDLLSMMLMAVDEDGAGVMSDQQVRDEAITIFLAGHETTANALTWTWYLLSQHPEVEAKLHAEVDRVLGGRLPEFEDLPNLKYAEMVLAESMRLYPPVWAIGRRAKSDYPVGGFVIPGGSVVILSPWVSHHDPRWYPDPLKFDPERWTPDESGKRPKFSYFPFGGGPRLCIGERFAWIEGTMLLAALAAKWRLRLDPHQKVEPKATITLRSRYGMRMRLEARG